MPEGDTIHKLARRLAPLLEGDQLEAVELWGRREPSLERRVERVSALGKHLLIELEGGETLRSHLGMHGSWRHFARDASTQASLAFTAEEARRAKHRTVERRSVQLVNRHGSFVCFDAEIVDCFPTGRRISVPGLSRIGHDLLSDQEPDWALVASRARHLLHPAHPLVDVLLDQRVAAGIGNVYKSELLFLHRVPTNTRLGELDDVKLVGLYRDARRLLQQNLGPWRRTTTVDPRSQRRRRDQPRLYVYGRHGESCLRCAAPITSARMGKGRRSTYWCPQCQAASR